MNKSFKRDRTVLEHILKYQNNLLRDLRRLDCTNSRAILNDETAIDLCAFAVLQVGELEDKLTDKSKSSITCLKSGALKTLRNQVAHQYGNMNKNMLVAFAIDLCSNQSIDEVRKRIMYCEKNMRT